MPSPKLGRVNETQCPVCLELVGVWLDRWGVGAWKIARHHFNQQWCPGAGLSVPTGAVIPT